MSWARVGLRAGVERGGLSGEVDFMRDNEKAGPIGLHAAASSAPGPRTPEQPSLPPSKRRREAATQVVPANAPAPGCKRRRTDGIIAASADPGSPTFAAAEALRELADETRDLEPARGVRAPKQQRLTGEAAPEEDLPQDVWGIMSGPGCRGGLPGRHRAVRQIVELYSHDGAPTVQHTLAESLRHLLQSIDLGSLIGTNACTSIRKASM
jgi:hypothetical protein